MSEPEKFDHADVEIIYNAFVEHNPVVPGWVGKWAVFKNNQIFQIPGRDLHHTTRGPVTVNRNDFIKYIYAVKNVGPGPTYPNNTNYDSPAMQAYYQQSQAYRLMEQAAPLAGFKISNSSLEEPTNLTRPYYGYPGYAAHIKDNEPELFERLKALFVVRQITQNDMPGILTILSGAA